ncbi:type II secretion system protein [Aporhodopirellula aestuarii]|uniref:Type II secretion system GspH family protein n=1 Tax=Aporhodopirellula aestuarii TaxID=2950107 RepID=A0ABT0U9E9_9BACT|nr:prepilin-type N-terminal cleavage/methylation domain-containing protein [Aporhodopirellula aestuarii]MCM2373603.1 type II secretion system GspH family protein [Aporhodopirellula aestuarii]
MKNFARSRKGYTLVELTVVILIIGVIATVAAPKFFDSLTKAQDNSATQTLQVVRDAIELYKANNGDYPGADGAEATLKTNLDDYLRNDFPTCQVGKRDDAVKIETDGAALSGKIDGTTGWIYDKSTGEFRINHSSYSTL